MNYAETYLAVATTRLNMEQQKTVPLDIVRFLSIENEQLLVSFANNKDELALTRPVRLPSMASLIDI